MTWRACLALLSLLCMSACGEKTSTNASTQAASTTSSNIAMRAPNVPPTPPEVRTVFAAGSFPLDYKGWSATLSALSGIDTSVATMVGRVTEADAREYCSRDPGGMTKENGGDQTVAQCVAGTVKEESGTQQVASADCLSKSISSTRGKFEMVGNDKDTGLPIWKSVADQETLDGSSASGADTVTAQFETLCPATSRAWKAR